MLFILLSSCYAAISVFKILYLRHVREMVMIAYDLCLTGEVEFAILYDLNRSKIPN